VVELSRIEQTVRATAHAGFALADSFRSRMPGLRILIYHQVGSGHSHEMNLPLEVFRRQIDWLQATYEIVGLEEALDRRGDVDADRLVVLTFDDGYADVHRHAFPLLQQRRIPFTLYITTGPTEDPGRFPDWPGEPLSWDQIEEMAASGLMTVGAHTHTHPDLRDADEETVVYEVEESNRLIEERLGVRPRHFTYTKGWWSPVAGPVIRAGYDTATLGMGDPITPDSDPHQLNRLAVNQSEPFWVWRRKLKTGGVTENRVRRRLHGYRGP
jgi:peptidoglycan/xylan/chitin deacetylase (PgdA/CDA1 family)